MTQAQDPRPGTADPGGEVRVGVYVRRSTDDEHQSYSIEAQDARVAAYIGSQPGWRQAPGSPTTPPGPTPAGPACSGLWPRRKPG
jgi:hypothetical protein